MSESFYLDVIQAAVACLLLILIGFLFSRFKILSAKNFTSLNKYSAKICFPFLLFRSLASRPFKEITFEPLLDALLTNVSTQILLTLLFTYKFEDRLYTYLSTVIGSCYINYIILGLPIFSSIWGNNYNQVPAICSFCHYIELVPFFLIMAQLWKIRKAKELDPNEDQGITCCDVANAFWTAVKTPLVVGNICGLIWSAIGIPYVLFFKKMAQYLGDGISVCALIGIGRFLEQKSLLSCHWLQLLCCLTVRFFVFPGFALLYATVFGFSNRTGRQCVVCAMLPAANAGFILANSVGVGANVCSAMVFWSLVLIVPILILWFYIMDHYGIFVDDLSDIVK